MINVISWRIKSRVLTGIGKEHLPVLMNILNHHVGVDCQLGLGED